MGLSMERFEEYLREKLPEVESFHSHIIGALAQILLGWEGRRVSALMVTFKGGGFGRGRLLEGQLPYFGRRLALRPPGPWLL